MCLFNNVHEVKLIKKGKKLRKAYKVLVLQDDGRLTSPVRITNYMPGYNHAHNPLLHTSTKDGAIVQGGVLHVYRTKRLATRQLRFYKKSNRVVVPVYIDPKDVRAASRHEICTTSLFINIQDYNKAIAS